MKTLTKLTKTTFAGLMILGTLTGCNNGGGLAAVFEPTEINLNDYLTVSVSGYEPLGTVTAEIDWDSIEKDYGEKLEFTKEAEEELGAASGLLTPIEYLKRVITVESSEMSGLSNGDTVVYSFNELSGSEEALKNVTINAEDGTYEVSGLGKYIESTDEVTSEALTTMQERAQSYFDGYAADASIGSPIYYYDSTDILTGREHDVHSDSIEYVGYIVASAEDKNLVENTMDKVYNKIYLVYKYTASIYIEPAHYINGAQGQYSFYSTVMFPNITIDGEGNCDTNFDETKLSIATGDIRVHNTGGNVRCNGYESIDQLVEEINSDWTIVYDVDQNIDESNASPSIDTVEIIPG